MRWIREAGSVVGAKWEVFGVKFKVDFGGFLWVKESFRFFVK